MFVRCVIKSIQPSVFKTTLFLLGSSWSKNPNVPHETFWTVAPKKDNPRGEKKQLFKLFILITLNSTVKTFSQTEPKPHLKKHDYFSNKTVKKTPKKHCCFFKNTVLNYNLHPAKTTKTRRQIKSMFFNFNFAQSHREQYFKRTQTLFIIILNNKNRNFLDFVFL
jgi:hypothetical protein